MTIMLHVSLLLTLQVLTRHVRLCASYMSVKSERAELAWTQDRTLQLTIGPAPVRKAASLFCQQGFAPGTSTNPRWSTNVIHQTFEGSLSSSSAGPSSSCTLKFSSGPEVGARSNKEGGSSILGGQKPCKYATRYTRGAPVHYRSPLQHAPCRSSKAQT